MGKDGESDTDCSKTTDTTGNSSDASSVSSVGSRRSTRNRRTKRNDDSLSEALELKNQNQRCKSGKINKKVKVKEVGVKPNKIGEIARKAALNDAKRLNALVMQEQKLKEKSLKQSKSKDTTSLGCLLGAVAGAKTKPTTSESTIDKSAVVDKSNSNCSLNKEDDASVGLGSGILKTPCQLIHQAASTPKFSEDLTVTPQKKKLMEENETLRQLLKKAKAAQSENQITDDIEQSELSDDTDKNITVIHRDVGKNTAESDKQTAGDGLMMQEKHNIFSDNDANHSDSGEKKKKKKHRKKSKSKSLKKKRKKNKKSSKKSKKKRRRSSSTSSSSSDSSRSSSSTSESSASEEEGKKKRKRKKRRAKVRSDQLLYTSECSDVEEIVKRSGIYMKQGAVAALKRVAKSHTSAARGYLIGVFKTDALKECSLKGNKTKGPLGKTLEARPALFGPGLDAVLEASRQIAKVKKFEIMKEALVNHELATKQSELRSVDKILAANQGAI